MLTPTEIRKMMIPTMMLITLFFTGLFYLSFIDMQMKIKFLELKNIFIVFR